jgi:hypothetical protein
MKTGASSRSTLAGDGRHNSLGHLTPAEYEVAHYATPTRDATRMRAAENLRRFRSYVLAADAAPGAPPGPTSSPAATRAYREGATMTISTTCQQTRLHREDAKDTNASSFASIARSRR